MKKQITKFWKHFIKGDYHCDSCPCGWSEYSTGCEDWDAGCVIKGDISDGACRLIPPFRTIIGWVRTRQRDYYLGHEYDDYPAYMEKEQREIDRIKESIKQHVLVGADLYYSADLSGNYKPLDEDRIEALLRRVWEVRHDYENVAHPFVYKPLRLEWQELIIKTVRQKFIEPFIPFLPQKRRRNP